MVYHFFMRNNFPILVIKEATLEIDKMSNITPTIVEKDIDTLKIQSDKFQRKNYNVFCDIDDNREEDDNMTIQPRIKRGK